MIKVWAISHVNCVILHAQLSYLFENQSDYREGDYYS